MMLSELILSAVFIALSVAYFHTVLFPPAGLFGLLFLVWFAPNLLSAASVTFLFGILADAAGGSPVGVHLIAYLILFVALVVVKPFIPLLNPVYFMLISLASLLVVYLFSASVFLLTVPETTLENLSFSPYPFLTAPLIALPIFVLYERFRKLTEVEE